MYHSENLPPGEGRVTFLKFYYFLLLNFLSYSRMTNNIKSVGYWKIKDYTLYYSFMMIDEKLHGSKQFSIIKEDWIELKFVEEVKNVSIPSEVHLLKDQVGIQIPSNTKSLVNQTIKRVSLPENGKKKILKKVF
jgi:hypothetical protein